MRASQEIVELQPAVVQADQASDLFDLSLFERGQDSLRLAVEIFYRGCRNLGHKAREGVHVAVAPACCLLAPSDDGAAHEELADIVLYRARIGHACCRKAHCRAIFGKSFGIDLLVERRVIDRIVVHALVVSRVVGNDDVGPLIKARKERDVAVIPVIFLEGQAL